MRVLIIGHIGRLLRTLTVITHRDGTRTRRPNLLFIQHVHRGLHNRNLNLIRLTNVNRHHNRTGARHHPIFTLTAAHRRTDVLRTLGLHRATFNRPKNRVITGMIAMVVRILHTKVNLGHALRLLRLGIKLLKSLHRDHHNVIHRLGVVIRLYNLRLHRVNTQILNRRERRGAPTITDIISSGHLLRQCRTNVYLTTLRRRATTRIILWTGQFRHTNAEHVTG